MKKIFAAVVSAVLLASPLLAQNDAGNSRSERGNRRQGSRGNRRQGPGGMFDPAAWEKAQEELRQKDPKTCEEIDKLAKTNLMAAMQKMREAMQKQNISMPGRGNRRQGFPGSEHNGPHGGFGPGMMLPPDGMRFNPGSEERGKALESVKAKLPKEYESYEKHLKDVQVKKDEISEMEIQAEKEIAALAKKARVTLPESMASYRLKEQYLRNKYKSLFEKVQNREEMKKLLAKLAADEGLSLGERPQMRFGDFRKNPESKDGREESGRRSDPMGMMREISRLYPEEMKEIRKLRREDPELAKQKMQSLVRKYNESKKK